MENWNDVRAQFESVMPEQAEALKKFDDPKAFVAAALRPEPEAPDWRKVLAGDNADMIKRLERFSDPMAYDKAFQDTQTALRDSGRIKLPGPNATQEEMLAYRRAIGVPETVDGYKVEVQPPQGYKVTDDDKAFLSETMKKLHEAGAPPQFVNLAHQIYYESAVNTQAALEDRFEKSAIAADEQLNKLWGSRKAENVAWANAAVSQFFGGEAKDGQNPEILDLKIQTNDGWAGNLGDWPPFVAMMAQIGRQNAEDPYFLRAAGHADAPDPEARKREIMALRSTNPREYQRLAAEGGELDKINAAIERRKGRAA